jgi:hypothetical protein
VSSADLAILSMAVVSLASIGRDYKLHRKALEKMGDRLRLVNPPKEKAENRDSAAGTVTDLARKTG